MGLMPLAACTLGLGTETHLPVAHQHVPNVEVMWKRQRGRQPPSPHRDRVPRLGRVDGELVFIVGERVGAEAEGRLGGLEQGQAAADQNRLVLGRWISS